MPELPAGPYSIGWAGTTTAGWAATLRVDLSNHGGYAKAFPGEPPMTTFDKRKDAFESKFAHDAELRFKAESRRNKLLGAWAAKLLGKQGADADAYVRSVIESDF